MVLIERLSTIKLSQMKKHQLSQYTDEKTQLMEPSIDKFQFYLSYNFVILLSIRNLQVLFFYFNLKANLDFLNLYVR
jgi:uncharacterized protein (UPF0305 family)